MKCRGPGGFLDLYIGAPLSCVCRTQPDRKAKGAKTVPDEEPKQPKPSPRSKTSRRKAKDPKPASEPEPNPQTPSTSRDGSKPATNSGDKSNAFDEEINPMVFPMPAESPLPPNTYRAVAEVV